jgi:adenosylhomocysteine nucleosidase
VTRTAFVTGLRAEAKILETAAKRAHRAPPAIACAGAHAGRAHDGAARLIADGAEAVLSFGLCGGLDPALKPGTLILAESVIDQDGRRFDADPVLRSCLLSRLQAIGGTLLGSDRPISSAAEKTRLHGTLGAVAVDMESHGVARAAKSLGVPFLAVRAVADPAMRDLPQAALAATGPDGGLRHGAIIGALLCRPWEIAAMIRLGAEARRAFAALERAAETLLGGD